MNHLYPKLSESKTTANEVTTIEWNPRMDLLATVFCNGALTCSRLLSLQRIWHRQPGGKIQSVAWRPDGRVLAIGAYNKNTKQHVCSLHEVEKGKEINTIVTDKPITSVSWFQHSPLDENKRKMIEEGVLPERKETAFSHQLAHKQDQLNILLISTEDGVIRLYALGLFYLGSIYVSMHNTPSSIVKTHMSSCMRFLTIVISSGNISSLRVMKLETLQERSREVLKVSIMYAKIIDEMEYLDDTIKAMTTSWADVLAGLDNKLSSYGSRENKNPNDSMGGYTFLSADQFLSLFVGAPLDEDSRISDNLEKFITDMSEKGLKKLNTAIEQTCLRVQNLIVKNAIKCCFHLQSDLNLLRGMSLWKQRFGNVGLMDAPTVEAMKAVGAMIFKLAELQQVIGHSLESTKAFFEWLISIACSMNGEHTGAAAAGDIKSSNQKKLYLIQDFIVENFDYSTNDDLSLELNANQSQRPTCSNFTLEQVGQYLKNEPLTRLKYSFEKPGSNLWIDFYKRRIDHVEDNLLFYPHNAETSLIQEHKTTSKAIDDTFASIAENFKLCSENSCHIVIMKDFLRNAPTECIQVETDGNTHYTLFPGKQCPTSKYYLIVQSLENKTFKLISLEFQTPTRDDLLIQDARFFTNKAIYFLVVNETKKDTIIIHSELAKILEDPDLVERTSKDISKIFKTNDSIDRYSSQVVLKVDLQTEPPEERKHEPEMLVKKIEGIIGDKLFVGSGRKLIAFTSFGNKRLHLYTLDSLTKKSQIADDKIVGDEKIDESFIDTDLI